MKLPKVIRIYMKKRIDNDEFTGDWQWEAYMARHPFSPKVVLLVFYFQLSDRFIKFSPYSGNKK